MEMKKMIKANQDIRTQAKENKLPLWRIADALNICEVTIVKKLRHELLPEEKAKIRKIIKGLSAKFPYKGK